jgi:hypothetical protein
MSFLGRYKNKLFWCIVACYAFVLIAFDANAQVPGIISYQGKLAVNGTNSAGILAFKFALIAPPLGTPVTLWSHNGTSTAGNEPSGSAVSLAVSHGVYSVNLGDTNIANMTVAIPASAFLNSEVYLRIWVNDGISGFEKLSPDLRITAVGYALVARTTAEVPASAMLSGSLLASVQAQDTNLIASGYRLIMTIPAASWINGSSSNALSARSGHTAVWDGQEMVIWGGSLGGVNYSAAGSLYRPDMDTWSAVSSIGVPAARSRHTAVWSGTEMIVWGGCGDGDNFLATGGRFSPGTQTWSPVTATGAPEGRYGHVAVWTGSRMLIWGGLNNAGLLDDGWLYNPVSNQWTAINVPNPPEARSGATAVWGGDRLIVWGGNGGAGELNSGAQLTFTNDVPAMWVPLNNVGAPSARRGHSAVWTGDSMIVWGGCAGETPLGDGVAYNVASNTWQVLSAINAPSPRYDHATTWSGSQMLIAGGADASGALSSGAAYDPGTGQWQTLSSGGAPLARSQSAIVWSGTELLVFGGWSGTQPVGTLQRLSPQPAWSLYRK